MKRSRDEADDASVGEQATSIVATSTLTTVEAQSDETRAVLERKTDVVVRGPAAVVHTQGDEGSQQPRSLDDPEVASNGGLAAENGSSASVKTQANGVAGQSGTTSTTRTGGEASPSLTGDDVKPPKRPKLDIQPVVGWRKVAEDVIRSGDAGADARALKGDGGVTSRRKFAVVCSANFNRSMMAHQLLQEHRFAVKSYGTGKDVRLPGKSVQTPEVFPFGTKYVDVYDTLEGKDQELFRRNNLLGLLARNATIKPAPQRFQEIPGPEMTDFDVVLCFDSRVFHLVVEDLQARDPELFKPLHVVNLTIKDSPEESAAAAGSVLGLCQMAGEALEAFAKKTRRAILHQVCHV